MTRGIKEITQLGVAMGGHSRTFHGLSGIGDLIVTCGSKHSRNRRAGILIGKGGSMLRKIGQEARADLEDFFQIKVNLQCWVKVKEGWRNREGMIKNFGLE